MSYKLRLTNIFKQISSCISSRGTCCSSTSRCWRRRWRPSDIRGRSWWSRWWFPASARSPRTSSARRSRRPARCKFRTKPSDRKVSQDRPTTFTNIKIIYFKLKIKVAGFLFICIMTSITYVTLNLQCLSSIPAKEQKIF